MILSWSPFKIVSVSAVYSSNLGTFWFKIEQFWPFEEISIFSKGGHLGYRTALIAKMCSMSRSTYPAILK
jgi:hypothetical protein